MTSERFRLSHSTLIEHYQFIEFNLKGIYAAISGTDFLTGLTDADKDSMGQLLKEIRKIEKERSVTVFTWDDYEHMEKIVRRRNFWCHSCYTDLVMDPLTDAPKRSEDIQKLYDDLNDAEHLREKLHEIKLEWMRKQQDAHPAVQSYFDNNESLMGR